MNLFHNECMLRHILILINFWIYFFLSHYARNKALTPRNSLYTHLNRKYVPIISKGRTKKNKISET